MEHKKYLLFECLLDISTNLVGTMVAHDLKNTYPDREIIVVTLYPEVWLHNPDIFRVFKIGTFQYFYEDYVKNKDILICRHNPTLTTSYIQAKKSLQETWCDLYGVKCNTNTPRLFFTWREHEAVQKLTKSNKPLLFIESESTPIGFGRTPTPQAPTNWPERIPSILLQTVAQSLQEKGFRIVDISESNKSNIPGIEKLNLNLRLKICAFKYANCFLGIHSFGSHISALFNIPAVVLWLCDSLVVWGYQNQENIIAKTDKDLTSFLQIHKKEFSLTGVKICPYNLNLAFDADEMCKKIQSISIKNDTLVEN